MKKKILVTGGTGFIGSALVKALVNDGNKVRVLDNQSRGKATRLKSIKGQFEMVVGDIRNPKIVEKACRGMDSVVHLAYINGTQFFYTKPELVLEVGVKGMINVLDGCIRHGVKELVLMSSSEVYQTPLLIPTPETVPLIVPDPLNPRYSYGGGKIISELLAINYGRKYFKRVLIIRPHNVYGPDMGWEHVIPQFILRMQKLVRESKDGVIRFPIQGSGKETRAFVYIDDFIEGLKLVMDKGEHLGIYHVGTMDEVTIKMVALEIGRCFQKKVIIAQGKLLEGSTLRRCPDIGKLEKLGFKPKVSLRDGLQKTVQWYNAFAHLRSK